MTGHVTGLAENKLISVNRYKSHKVTATSGVFNKVNRVLWYQLKLGKPCRRFD